MRRRPLRFALPAAVAAATVAAPSSAAAAGFSPPVAVSPKAEVAQPVAAVAPTGRTAVGWLATRGRNQGFGLVARVGDAPERLAPAADVPGSARASEPRLAAAPDGTITACWQVDAYRRRGAIRCAVAPAGQAFGAAQTLATYRAGTQLALTGLAVDGTGRSVVGWKRASGRGRYALSVAIGGGGAGGRFGRPAALGTTDSYTEVQLATGGAGEVAALWSVPKGRAISPRTPFLATLAPGAPAFGRATAVTLPVEEEGTPMLRGGRALSLLASGEAGPVALLRGGAGAGSALRPVRLASSTAVRDASPAEALVSVQPDGSTFTVTRFAAVADTDCSEETRSQLFAATLPAGAPGPPPALVPLSDPRQLVSTWDVAELADGRTIVLWGDGFGFDRRSRVEFAVRTPDGALSPATTIAPTTADYPVLASGGTHAVLVLLTGKRLDGPSQVLLSTFRDTAPFALTGPRPAHPSTGCA